jgi:hypothetical protein
MIDPVGTGYSRAKSTDVARRMNGVQGDIQSVAEFIRLYITRNNRWMSPIFIAGESYGTFRAAGLAGNLVDSGIAVNGVVLISTILNYGTGRASLINNTPYALSLPTYTADVAQRRNPLRTSWANRTMSGTRDDGSTSRFRLDHASDQYRQARDGCEGVVPAAAQPLPVVFSNVHNRFMEVSQELCTSFPPIGTLPSNDVIDRSRAQGSLGFKERYQLNEWTLMGTGDILLLYTDGLVELGEEVLIDCSGTLCVNQNGYTKAHAYQQSECGSQAGQKTNQVFYLHHRSLVMVLLRQLIRFTAQAPCSLCL